MFEKNNTADRRARCSNLSRGNSLLFVNTTFPELTLENNPLCSALGTHILKS